jgi:hypothetical protein
MEGKLEIGLKIDFFEKSRNRINVGLIQFDDFWRSLKSFFVAS